MDRGSADVWAPVEEAVPGIVLAGSELGDLLAGSAQGQRLVRRVLGCSLSGLMLGRLLSF